MQAGYGSQALVEGYGCVAVRHSWRVMAVWQSHNCGGLWLCGSHTLVECYGCVAVTQWWRVMAVWQSHLGGVLWLCGSHTLVECYGCMDSELLQSNLGAVLWLWSVKEAACMESYGRKANSKALSWPNFQNYIDGQGRADLPYPLLIVKNLSKPVQNHFCLLCIFILV